MSHPYQIMTHIVAGYPSLKESEDIATTMFEAGIDFLEIQIPFSDPIGDGPVITKACRSAIASGMTVEKSFQLMAKLKPKTKIPLLFMTYYNIIFHYGGEAFCKRAEDLGCYGLIIPDLPFDEESYDHFRAHAQKHHLKIIQLVSPITPEDRLKHIGEVAEGFVYCVAGFGTTGSTLSQKEEVGHYLERVRKYIKVPLALGFGICTKEEMNKAGKVADIIVIGSQILKLYQASSGEGGLRAIKKLLIRKG